MSLWKQKLNPNYQERRRKARKHFKKKVLDRKIFREFPEVRDIIGNFGDEVRKVRPVGYVFGRWLKQESDNLPVQAWVIADWDTWRRDLIPCEVVDNQRRGLLSRFTACRTLQANTVPTGWEYTGKGLLLKVPSIGFILNPWAEHVYGDPVLDDFHFDQSICGRYRFQCDGFTDEPYYPLEDVYLKPEHIGD
jgi:hypothetical protein